MKKIIFLILISFNLMLNSAEVKLADINFQANNVFYRIEPEVLNNKYYTFRLYLKTEYLGELECYQKNDFYYISFIHIYEHLRNRGYGALLLKNVISYLKQMDVNSIRLLPHPPMLAGDSDEYKVKRKDLCKYYYQFGFVQVDSDYWEMKIK